MNRPTLNQIEILHKKYATSKNVFDLVFTHSLIVNEIAKQLIIKKNIECDTKLVTVGALLRDIGAYTLINKSGEFYEQDYILHGIRGYKILKQEGFDEEICLFAKRHTGVGISKEDIINQNINLPLDNYCAVTLEEKLVMYSDKFHSKKPNFNSFESYSLFIKKFGEDKAEQFNKLSKLFGIPDLEPLTQKYKHPII